MKEFGSDFHKYKVDFQSSYNFFSKLDCIRFYACGRHAIDAIVLQEGWKRIWIPAYFCHEVIDHISLMDIQIMLYDDYPLRYNDDLLIRSLPFRRGDVLLRVNFFCLRIWRSNKGIPVPVIEDHTHDLLSEWVLKSDADWCIASIRKSLPVAAGGILWSPTGKRLPSQIAASAACEEMGNIRYNAMELKRNYLLKGKGDKREIRDKYIRSEKMINRLELSGMDKESHEIFCSMDIKQWINLKRNNWFISYNLLKEKFTILEPKMDTIWQPFSLVILCDSVQERIRLRKYLIENRIYPAILWELPESITSFELLDFSQRMLSIHCDGRYSENEIKQMCQIINSYYD